MSPPRDHGGGLDAAIARHGGTRAEWLDLSTGINPGPYPVPQLPATAWTALPDQKAAVRLIAAARRFWNVPDDAALIAAPGASSLIARMPQMVPGLEAFIPGPTYNEHAAAFGDRVTVDESAPVHVYVHPNNPDGHLWVASDIGNRELTIVDESFCDVTPAISHVSRAGERVAILKSFGKFWGLAGLRLGFLICDPAVAARMAEALGPWPVSGPALEIGATALEDIAWAQETRARLTHDATRLDALMTWGGASPVGGSALFRLYEVDDAAGWQNRLARSRIWTRIFPYSKRWLRLGLPHPDRWEQLEDSLEART
ncbi:threonine-phosphate decarboxylase [Pseudoruegeria sp. HB172150]|uniref:threonine-phosphate decarboxylase n=1 Tax=Pseudoruegeria sp. HB172150 TaxID=2721164 RepID=UPI001556A885|nr:threonine-phosphate decarboxylase [Pseudoruegeria sp. HB172150]